MSTRSTTGTIFPKLSSVAPMLVCLLGLTSLVFLVHDASATNSTVSVPLREYEQLFQQAHLHAEDVRFAERLRNLERDYVQRQEELENERTRLIERTKQHERSAGADAQARFRSLFASDHVVLKQSADGVFNVTASRLDSARGRDSDPNSNVATFNVTTVLRVIADGEWVIVPVANASSIVASDWQLHWQSGTARRSGDVNVNDTDASNQSDGGGGGGGGGGADDDVWIPIDLVTDHQTILLQHKGQHVVMTNRSGIFRVSYNSHVRVRKSRHLQGLALSLYHPVTQASLRMVGQGAINELGVAPAASVVHIHETPTQPAATGPHNRQREPEDGPVDPTKKPTSSSPASHAEGGDIVLSLTMPPTSSFELKWLDHSDVRQTSQRHTTDRAARRASTGSTGPHNPLRDDDGESPSGSRPSSSTSPSSTPQQQQVTVAHDVLMSISQGLVTSTHSFVYKSTGDSSPLTTIDILVHDNATRVTSVVASGLQSWEVEQIYETLDSDTNDTTNATKPTNSSSNGKNRDHRTTNGTKGVAHSYSRLRAIFKSSHLDTVTTLMVYTEMAMETRSSGSTTDQFAVPVMESVGVLRQTGTIGVATVSNVLVDVQSSTGLTSAPLGDLASQLRLNTDRPIVIAFNYLTTRYSLCVRLTHHEQIDVLEAAVDRAHYTATVVDTHVAHCIELAMQHTSQQYVVLRGVPPSAHMFSVSVSGVPTKPVRDGSGTLMVPLLGSSRQAGDNDGSSHLLKLSVSYLSKHTPNGTSHNGTFALSLPQLELPISVLTAEVRLPDRWDYNFTSEFGEDVEDYTNSMHGIAGSDNSGSPGERIRRKRMLKELEKRRELDGDDGSRTDADADGGVRTKRRAPKRFQNFRDASNEQWDDGSGVRVVLPDAGKRYFFERVLVVDTPISINVTYYTPPPLPLKPVKWWQLEFWSRPN